MTDAAMNQGQLAGPGKRKRLRRRRRIPEGAFEADIEDLSDDGYGVARVDGKVCFIHGALPGEKVRFAYSRSGKDFDQGTLLEVLVPSADRVAPPCPHFEVCGGCSLQHLRPAAQLEFKQTQLLQSLERIGRVKPEAVAAPLTGPSLAYRRRARLGARYVGKMQRALVGFRERSSSRLAVLERCAVLDARIGSELRSLGELIGSLDIRREVPQVEVTSVDQLALVFRVLSEPSAQDRQKLEAYARQLGCTIYLQAKGPDSVVPLIPGSPPLSYSPDGGGDRLLLEPTDFIQVNETISQAMVSQALDWLAPQPGNQVLELFCGLGNFSIPLARRGAVLSAIEGEAALVRRAQENAARLNLDIDFHVANLFEPDPAATWLAPAVDQVLLDPPRAGAQEMIPLIAKLRPARIVYVSCHPGTLARDAGKLVEQGYRLRKVGVMDMFPHTAHIESMALFEWPESRTRS